MIVNKMQFLRAVQEKTVHMPPSEVNRLLEYYNEMIDEAVEEGLSEEEAVDRLGTWEEICAQIEEFRTSESQPIEAIKEEPAKEPQNPIPDKKPKKHVSLPMWAVVLLILTSPIWGAIVLSLGIAVFAVIVSLVVIGGALVISLFAVVLSLAIVGVVGIPAAVVLFFTGSIATGLLSLGGGLVCGGFAILGWFLCIAFAKFVAVCVKGLFGGIVKVIGR